MAKRELKWQNASKNGKKQAKMTKHNLQQQNAS
jgi:hypothetical protein